MNHIVCHSEHDIIIVRTVTALILIVLDIAEDMSINVDNINGSTNATNLETSDAGFRAVMIFLWIIVLLTVIGNLVTLSVLLTKKNLRKRPDTRFLVSLSVADLAVGLFVMIPSILKNMVSKTSIDKVEDSSSFQLELNLTSDFVLVLALLSLLFKTF